MITNDILVEKINNSIKTLNETFSNVLDEKIEFNAVIDSNKVYIGIKTKFNKDLTNQIFKINPGYEKTKLKLSLEDYSLNDINNPNLKKYQRLINIYPHITLYKNDSNVEFKAFCNRIIFDPLEENKNPWAFVEF